MVNVLYLVGRRSIRGLCKTITGSVIGVTFLDFLGFDVDGFLVRLFDALTGVNDLLDRVDIIDIYILVYKL
jgi:hypothetical protein